MSHNKVRGYRVMLGLTQEDLGKILECTAQAISSKENGKTNFKDAEKEILLTLFKKIDKSLTIDEIFFNKKVSKS